jgi:pimeloyl-ACP methyl ester carboxylesterase
MCLVIRRGRPQVRRWVGATGAGLALLMAVTACSESVDGQAEEATFSVGAGPTPSLDRFYGQTIRWESCAAYADQEVTGYPEDRSDCATITVPVDYENPDGDAADIAIFRVRASGDKVGSLLMNPGGPGASGVEFMAGQAQSFGSLDLGKRFDLIGFDPRGIGRSTPQIRCFTAQERDEARAETLVDMSPAGIAKIEAENRADADKCAQRVGTDFLAHVGTVDVVKDMDVLRAALGDDKLNYLGYSYGTKIGSAYAEQFPTKVRAMVNDGAVDPSANPVDENIRQLAGFQSTFDAFAADCINRGDCALGDDPAAATTRFQELTRPLIDKPAPTSDGRPLSYGDAMTGAGQAMYSDALWEPLRDALTELAGGRGDTLLRLADLYEGRDAAGDYTNSTDAFTAIRCVDDPRLTDQAEIDRLDVEGRRAAPFTDDGRGTGKGARDVCAFWPVPPTSAPHDLNIPNLPTTVVISTTNDPATPYQAGVDLAAQLGARLITFEGAQHTASLEGHDCVDDAVTEYFVNLTLPDEGLKC